MPEFFIALGIILAIAVLFALFILSLKGTLTVAYNGEFSISFRVLFFKISFPAKKKQKHYRKTMSRRKARRIRKAVERKPDLWGRIKEMLFGKKEEKKPTAEKKPQKKAETAAPDISAGTVATEVIDILSAFTEIIGVLVKRFTHHLRIRIARFKIKIATEDPAVTAVTYGAASQIINVLLPILGQVEHLGLPKEKHFELTYDFISTAPEIDLKVSFSLRVLHVADIAIRSLIGGISKYVGRKGGIDKTFEHIGKLIDQLSPKDKAPPSNTENKK